MSIQSQLNDDSISCLPRIAAIINASESFEANQMYCYTLQSMLNLSICVADKDEAELEEYQVDLIATFREKGLIKQEIKKTSILDDGEESTVIVSVDCCGESDFFCVQTVDGVYRQDLGCWVTSRNSHNSISSDDYPLFDIDAIVEHAEKYIQSLVKEESTKYKINAKDVYLLIRDEYVEVVTQNSNYINKHTSSYQREFDESFGKFDSKEEALEYLENLEDEE